jgi:hypothetical protein
MCMHAACLQTSAVAGTFWVSGKQQRSPVPGQQQPHHSLAIHLMLLWRPSGVADCHAKLVRELRHQPGDQA